MKIVDALRTNRAAFSFEFFPPKDEAGLEQLSATISELKPYAPIYVSVTYGAGGSTRDLTVDLVRRIKNEIGIESMAHLTCVGSSRNDIEQVLRSLEEANIDNVLALRGDPPKGATHFERPALGFAAASELATFIRARSPVCLAGACYPEGHPENPGLDAELDNMQRKQDAGVEFLITQLFFDNTDYYRLRDRAANRGIYLPIVCGLMPITNVAQVKRFTQMCGARIPATLLERLEPIEADRARVRALGVEYATQQAQDLLQNDAPGIHFYTLNRSLATREILDNLRGSSN